jgi:(1->4)-alpha-D-glucan 1-alpha-D-glucosylmutase
MPSATLQPVDASGKVISPACQTAETKPESALPSAGESPVPGATYRLQFNRSFTFRDARQWIQYFADLGVTHCYGSPYLKARSGSPHGYDILDHNALNPEIGSEEEFDEFVSELQDHGLRQILDVVPNHMGVAACENAWWMDVLEHGPNSPYASFFDIDWMPLKPDLAHKVLLPVLGDQFGKVLEDQQLVLKHIDGSFCVQYHDHRFPIATQSLAILLRHRIDALQAQLGSDNPDMLEYHSILTAIGHLPARTETESEKVSELRREKEVIKRRIAELQLASSEVRTFIEENVRIFNGTPGDPRSFDLLDRLLQEQAYRLAHWRVAADEINYRRFFDVNELAAICMENREVFDRAHDLIFKLLAARKIHGLRIDHPDGLYDPAEYLRRLHETYAAQSFSPSPLYVVVEKILEPAERLPETWLVHGTTGYEFLNLVNGIFVDRSHVRDFDRIYAQFIRRHVSFRDLVYECKKLIMQVSMSSEISVLGHQLDRISEQDRWSRDFTLNSLTATISEIIACFPVYRTYITESGVLDRDRRYIETAAARVKRKNPAISSYVVDFVRDTLLLKYPANADEPAKAALRRFVGKFQQVTGPVMAKGVEDTAFYVYNRLVSLNEVGGDPDKFGVSVAAFHQHNLERQAHWPFSLLATSTHDTKRGEDVRARINVLSEIPREWKAHLFRWSRLNQRRKLNVDAEPAPSRNDEYLLYQTLIGTWPFKPPSGPARQAYIERIQQYMVKATREAKVHTSWISPNDAYEQATRAFISAILGEKPNSAFLADFSLFAQRIADAGIWNSLSQTMLKLTCPGVPDLYQGSDLWDFRLVDPDNRQPVDFALRKELLQALQNSIDAAWWDLTDLAQELMTHRYDGRIKLYVLLRSLRCRRGHPDLFMSGSYVPLEASGTKKEHVCAFARRHEGKTIIAVVPRLSTRLTGEAGTAPLGQVWEDTSISLPDALRPIRFRNVFTCEVIDPPSSADNGEVRMASILRTFPVALLESAKSDARDDENGDSLIGSAPPTLRPRSTIQLRA